MSMIQTIAIIDDDDIYRFASKRIINATNRTKNIQTYSNGEKAINFFKENLGHPNNLPDIIFLDLNMPIIDGWQFLDMFKLLKPKINKNIPIYIFSSSINPDDLIASKQIEEVSNYLVKPITEEKFLNIIDNLKIS